MQQGRDDIGTIDDLRDSARSVTGIEDFGDNSYLEPLRILLESYAAEAQLTPIGNRVVRSTLRGALVARQVSEASAIAHPQHVDVTVVRPIFVTGLPRSGTTALHRLLCADPAHQGLEMWFTEAPQPRPPRDTWEANPVFRRLRDALGQFHVENPEFMGVHYLAADAVEECWQLLRQSMMSISYESLAHIPSYSDWLADADWAPAYERHRRNLQLIGLNDAHKRWVLKNPSHLFALPAILRAYPDALIVQTHREPATVIASMSSLTAQVTAGQSSLFTSDLVGRTQLELWARGADRFTADRERLLHPHIVDVRYDDFVSDPLATVASIYDRFDIELSSAARAAMASLHAESATGAARPSHTYALEDYGLTVGDVDERFFAYRSKYFG